MPFPSEIREMALVLAARHCCVCHRYRGVKVEVHHVVPEPEGGARDLDNAIALCFDCHCDAGHYNPLHPKGSKLSNGELRKHRDRWYQMVAENRIESPSGEDSLHTRYLVCESFLFMRRISEGNFGDIPVTDPRSVPNNVLSFHSQLLRAYRNPDRTLTLHGPTVDAKADITARPGCSVIYDIHDPCICFSAVWPPTEEDSTAVARQDPLTRDLLRSQIPAAELFSAGAHCTPCEGHNGYQISYELRPIWAVYLAVTNMDDDLVILQSIHGGIHDGTGEMYRAYSPQPVGVAECPLPLPLAPLPKGATAIIPIGTMLGALEPVSSSDKVVWSSEETECADHAIRVFQHGDFKELVGAVHLIGPHLQPRYLEYSRARRLMRQDLHDFDLSNIYRLGRYWLGGSCPHCFWRNGQGLVTYAGELLPGEPDIVQTLSFQVPPDTQRITIAELEHEVTTLHYIKIDDIVLCREVILAKDQCLDLFARGAKVMEVRGSYHLTHDVGMKTDSWMKNRIIGRFVTEDAVLDSRLATG